jgi:hypothetical protein
MRVRAALQPRSARFELVGLLRSVQSLVPHVRLSVSLAGPGPSDGADPSRRCQGCCPPFPSSQRSGCPQLQPARCDGPTAVSFHHRTVRERLVALEVSYPDVGNVRYPEDLYPEDLPRWPVAAHQGTWLTRSARGLQRWMLLPHLAK